MDHRGRHRGSRPWHAHRVPLGARSQGHAHAWRHGCSVKLADTRKAAHRSLAAPSRKSQSTPSHLATRNRSFRFAEPPCAIATLVAPPNTQSSHGTQHMHRNCGAQRHEKEAPQRPPRTCAHSLVHVCDVPAPRSCEQLVVWCAVV